jgi:hypothetical protein
VISRSPTAVDLAVLFGTVLGLVALVHWAELPHLFGRNAGFGLAALSTVMIGVPALAWALDRGQGSAIALVGAGALAGAVTPLVLLVSGLLRLLVLESFDYVLGAVSYGAIIPGRGPLAWSRFATLMVESTSIGTLTGLAIWATSRMGTRRN